MCCCSDLDEKEKPKFSCKGIQHNNNEITYKRFEDVLFNGVKDKVLNKGFRYVDGTMKSYEQNKDKINAKRRERCKQKKLLLTVNT